MSQNHRATIAKRQRELAQKDKQKRREERRAERRDRIKSGLPGDDPDLADLVLAPPPEISAEAAAAALSELAPTPPASEDRADTRPLPRTLARTAG